MHEQVCRLVPNLKHVWNKSSLKVGSKIQATELSVLN